MVNIFQSLLLVIAGATQKQLARRVKYLKVENQILRARLPKRIVVTRVSGIAWSSSPRSWADGSCANSPVDYPRLDPSRQDAETAEEKVRPP